MRLHGMNCFYICLLFSVALACEHNGKTYNNGDVWIDREIYKVRCITEPDGSWRISVFECIGPDGIAMPVRSEKVIDGRIWECKMDDKGEIKLSQRSDDTLSCDGHPYGSEWEEDWRKYRCGEGGMKEFMGCIESSGIFIANGEVKSVDGSYIECKKHEDGSVTMQGVEKLNRVMCRDIEGREREEGFEWKEGPLQYRCGRKGVKEFMGCITPSGIFIASGGVVSVDGFDLECKKLANGTIRMRLLQRSKIKCKDREGREWEEGSEWKEGLVQYRCGKEGMKEVMGCFTTSGIFIATGEVVSMDGSDVRCIENGNTYVIVMSPAKHDTLCKDSEGREWEEGSEWKEESVLYRCGKEGRKRVMGCITISGVLIRKGEVKSVDGSDFECMKHANGSITMRMLGRSIMKCKDREGREWEEGSEWKEGSVQYKCGKEGVKELMGCITTSGVLIRKGEVKSVDGSDIECRKHANGFITMQVLAKYECKGINGRWRKLGEIWRERQRIEGEYRCDKGGVRTVLGCIAGGKYIPIHSQTHIWGAYHLCTSDAYGANLERQYYLGPRPLWPPPVWKK